MLPMNMIDELILTIYATVKLSYAINISTSLLYLHTHHHRSTIFYGIEVAPVNVSHLSASLQKNSSRIVVPMKKQSMVVKFLKIVLMMNFTMIGRGPCMSL